MKIKKSKDYFTAVNTILIDIIENNTIIHYELVLQSIIESLSFRIFKKINKATENKVSITLTRNELFAMVYWYNKFDFKPGTFEYNTLIEITFEYHQILANEYYGGKYQEQNQNQIENINNQNLIENV
jgi:hypothetical protein